MDKLFDVNGNPLTYKDIDRYLWIIKRSSMLKGNKCGKGATECICDISNKAEPYLHLW